MKFADVSMLQTWRTYDWTSKHLLPRIVVWDNMFILFCCIVNFQKEAQMYTIISQYSKYFLLNSLNYPIKIAVRLKRMFNMLWFEYLRIMVGNIYQMYYMKSHWWWFLLLYSNMSIAWLSESILAEKTIQFYSNIICNLDKFKRYW